MNRLKFLREEKQVFQKDIANYLNCSIAIISMYEKEQRVMDVNIAQRLAEYFDVSVDYLLGKTDVRNYDKDEQDFRFAYHKEMEGLTEEEITDALRFYKEMKKKINKDKKEN